MDFSEFLDTLYAGWSKTTGAENRYYIVEQATAFNGEPDGAWHVWAVAQDESREHVAVFQNETTADWFASLHGAFPELYRDFLAMDDHNARLDERVDEMTGEIALLVDEIRELEKLYE